MLSGNASEGWSYERIEATRYVRHRCPSGRAGYGKCHQFSASTLKTVFATLIFAYVRYWQLADALSCTAHVCFWG
jgi:hypothetical protein